MPSIDNITCAPTETKERVRIAAENPERDRDKREDRRETASSLAFTDLSNKGGTLPTGGFDGTEVPVVQLLLTGKEGVA